jgi:hypothetical protein
MALYVTDEIVFEVPDGFVDRSLTILASTKASHAMSLTIDRNPAEGPLEDQVTAKVDTIKKVAPTTKVLGVRQREVGHLPAREVKMVTTAGRQQLYVRQTYVSYYGTLLSISLSSQRMHQQLCDAAAERLVNNVKFRRR